MKILSLSNGPLNINLGAGKAVIRYSEGLRKLGHTVEVVGPQDYESAFIFKRGIQYRQALGAWNLVRQKLKTSLYDLIEFYGGEFWLAAWYLSKWKKRPLLVQHTNGLELLKRERQRVYDPPNSMGSWFRDKFSRDIHARLARMAFIFTDALVCLCEADRRYALNSGLYPSKRIALIRHGLDKEYRSLPFLTHKEERIAFLGHWIMGKGIKYLPKVVTKVLKQNHKVSFDIYVSKDPVQKIFACFPKELHNRITVSEGLSNQEIARGLAKAKVFFFPSQYEGFGFALAEAMACSCAVVTTPAGFGAGLINKEEALLCGFDDTDAMEQAILQLLNNDALRQKIARGGWERTRSLIWEKSIKELESIYQEWLERFLNYD